MHSEVKSVATTRLKIYSEPLVVHTGKLSYICWLKYKYAFSLSLSLSLTDTHTHTHTIKMVLNAAEWSGCLN